MAGCRLTWWTSVGISVFDEAWRRFAAGSGLFACGPVIGMFRMSCLVLNFVFGILHADEILHAVLGIDPEILLVVSDAGVGGGDDAFHDVVLGQAELGRLGAIDDRASIPDAFGL